MSRVRVRRTGGITGVPVEAEQVVRGELVELLRRIDFAALGDTAPAPDRFVYRIEFEAERATVGETALTPDLRRLIELVLG